MRLLERGARRLLGALDAAATRAYGWRWNPLHQSGTVAVAMLLALLATGLYLVFVYRVGAPSASVARIAADPWLGGWIRTLHRYTSDLFIVAAALHFLRMFAQARSWGPRRLAWISGLMLLGAGLVCAWTGFVMAWDSFGERLAREGARLLDVLPVLSEPLSRLFAGDRPLPSAFFFVNLFVHIGLPLAMGALLWLHVSRVARPVLLPPRRITWTILAALTLAAVVLPAPLGPAADPFRLPADTPLNLFAAWWLPLTEQLPRGVVWGAGLGLSLALLFVPRFTRRARVERWAPSVVDPRLCTGCNQCPQDCPWDAITMVERDDDRPSLVALVNPARCVSCGICAGSCAPMGVGPPGRTGRDQLAAVRGAGLGGAGLGGTSERRVVAVCCSVAPESQVEAIRARGAHVHLVTCAGNLHSSVVEMFVRGGAAGVVICHCPPRDCIGREGPKWLHERLYNDREAELQPRVDRRRVRTLTLAPGARREALATYDAIARDFAALDLPAAELAEPDLVCEPVPVAKDDR
ncbi:MAG: cytochrome b N-terminal domain-containing protein [Gemmatimonadota bacterium]